MTLTHLDRELQYGHEERAFSGGMEQGGLLSSRLASRALLAWLAGVVCLAAAWGTLAAAASTTAPDPVDQLSTDDGEVDVVRASQALTYYVHLPALFRSHGGCGPIPDAGYGTLSVIPPPTDRPAEEHPDLNLAIRGYEPTTAYLGLVDYDGGIDPNAPQLAGLFADHRVPHRWEWDCDCLGPVYTSPQVTLLGMATAPDETIHVPASGYDIGGGYEVLVLYAAPQRITLKYTGEDNVVRGYTLHVENVCIDPTLVALYEERNEAGRSQLPALRAGQAFGYAQQGEIGVVIRDTGAFLDPRSRKDWWQ
jgi:hypothetical protein